jgi:hypothetical protein
MATRHEKDEQPDGNTDGDHAHEPEIPAAGSAKLTCRSPLMARLVELVPLSYTESAREAARALLAHS